LDKGALVLFTEPPRPTTRNPLKAYLILRIDRRVVRIERIAVAAMHRNAGLAQQLLGRGLRWRDQKHPNVPIWTYISCDNVASINAHVHAGFGIEAISGEWLWVLG
jgi:GNAT superfamily N-acetyltransferase